MIEPALYLAYVAACIAIVIVPGPNVTVIIANSLRYGMSAGMSTVLGTQAGLLIVLGILAVGLSEIVTHAGVAFDVLRWIGALYLIWLGVRLWRSDGRLGDATGGAPASGFFWQGLFVLLSNPKALLFFGAFIPQFIDPAEDTLSQTLVLGLTFMAVALVLDGGYALLAGRAGRWLTHTRVRLVERVSGSALILGGVWLALSKR